MSVLVVQGDARALPLPDGCVDLCVTSPPYFGLRSYTDNGQPVIGQVGAEMTPTEYVEALLAATREMVRVLKPSGSIFVNLGDKYVADNRGSGADAKRGQAKHAPRGAAGFVGTEIARQKSLMGMPWRYALRCIDDLGLILRAELVWSKPNGLPESVTDRVRRSHEQWFHFTLGPRYYSAVDAIRLPPSGYVRAPATRRLVEGQRPRAMLDTCNPLGALPGSVWEIPSEPLNAPANLGVDHFAAFPTEWPRRLIIGWSPPGICIECGDGRYPVASDYERIGGRIRVTADTGCRTCTVMAPGAHSGFTTRRSITGYACACPEPTAPTRPAVVLDPFGGTGTTALVAGVLGRIGVSCDLSADYGRLAQWRTTDPGELAKALRVPKPPVEVDDQASLFDREPTLEAL